MIRQCAWCCQVVGQTAPLDDLSVTHGLCPECHAKLLATQARGKLSAIVAPLEAPPSPMPGEANE